MLKGIILAGGTATRLFPATTVVSKQLLPVYDKPMIYYPLTTLMEAGCRDILVITNPENTRAYARQLEPLQAAFNLLKVVRQDQPGGIAQAITIAASNAHISQGDRVFLILGDNLFHGDGLRKQLQEAAACNGGASLFMTQVMDPERYGVAEFDEHDSLTRIHEKPQNPPSCWAVTGLYAYDDRCVDLVRSLRPSARGEVEITDLNNAYLQLSSLQSFKLSRSTAWLDTGTPDALLSASQYVQAIQHRSASLVGCPELTAVENGWLDPAAVRKTLEVRRDDYAVRVLRSLG